MDTDLRANVAMSRTQEEKWRSVQKKWGHLKYQLQSTDKIFILNPNCKYLQYVKIIFNNNFDNIIIQVYVTIKNENIKVLIRILCRQMRNYANIFHDRPASSRLYLLCSRKIALVIYTEGRSKFKEGSFGTQGSEDPM